MGIAKGSKVYPRSVHGIVLATRDSGKCRAWAAALKFDPEFEYVRDYCVRDHFGYVKVMFDDGVKARMVRFHRLVAGLDSEVVDHINNDPRDNRLENLRATTQRNNCRNQLKGSGSSRFKGVSFEKRRELWEAYIKKDYKKKFLGYFKNEVDAARAYDRAALEMFGEFARTNQSMGLFEDRP